MSAEIPQKHPQCVCARFDPRDTAWGVGGQEKRADLRGVKLFGTFPQLGEQGAQMAAIVLEGLGKDAAMHVPPLFKGAQQGGRSWVWSSRTREELLCLQKGEKSLGP